MMTMNEILAMVEATRKAVAATPAPIFAIGAAWTALTVVLWLAITSHTRRYHSGRSRR